MRGVQAEREMLSCLWDPSPFKLTPLCTQGLCLPEAEVSGGFFRCELFLSCISSLLSEKEDRNESTWWMISFPTRTKSHLLWLPIFPSALPHISHPACYWIRSIGLYWKDEAKAAPPTKRFLLCFLFALLWGQEKESARPCVVPFIWTFILTREYLGFCFLPSHVRSSLIFFKSNKLPSQILTKESQPWRSPELEIEAGLIPVIRVSLRGGKVVRSSSRYVLAGPSSSRQCHIAAWECGRLSDDNSHECFLVRGLVCLSFFALKKKKSLDLIYGFMSVGIVGVWIGLHFREQLSPQAPACLLGGFNSLPEVRGLVQLWVINMISRTCPEDLWPSSTTPPNLIIRILHYLKNWIVWFVHTHKFQKFL